jgi:tRNA-guanine family transglycosylase
MSNYTKIQGLFPVLYPDNLKDVILKHLRIERIMTSVAWLKVTQRKLKIHDVMNFKKMIFLDCGVFQRRMYQKFNSYTSICEYRQKLVEWYSYLRPDIASAFDVPSSPCYEAQQRLQRLVWSIENFEFLTQRLPNIPLVLGLSIFGKEDVNHLKRLIKKQKIEPEIIGLGGQVPLIRETLNNVNYGKMVLKNVYLLRSLFPDKPIHVYGGGDHRWYALLRLLGATSADYASYILIASHGAIILPGLGPRFILKKVRVETKKGPIIFVRPSDKILNVTDYPLLVNCQCPICRNQDPLMLEESKENRIIHNLYVILSETTKVDQYCENNDYKGLIKYIKNVFKDVIFKELARYAIKLYYKTT